MKTGYTSKVRMLLLLRICSSSFCCNYAYSHKYRNNILSEFSIPILYMLRRLLNNNYCLQKLLCILFIISSWHNVNAQFGNYGNFHIFSGGSIKVNGSVINTGSSATINNSGNLQLTGDFTNNGNDLDASGTGAVTFCGTTTQSINGAQASTFYDVTKPNSNDVIIANNETINNALTLTGGTFNLNNHVLTLNGPFSGTGTLTGSESSGLIIGGAAGTLQFTTGATNNYLNIFTVNTSSSAALGDSLYMNAGSLFGTVTANGTLTTNGKLVLKSDADGTSRVAESYGKITGNVTVERYIPPRRAWRFINVPFSSSTQTIRDAWQEGVNNSNLVYANNLNPNPGYGTHITGNNNFALGYDYNTTINPSLKVWQTNNWSANEPATISELVTSYPAYCLFVRGSRAVKLSNGVNAVADATVLRATGILNEPGVNSNNASQSFNANAEDFIFVGNPYASSIDITNTLQRSGGIYKNKFWVWDPKMNGTNNVGGYVSFSNGVWAPVGSGSYPAGNNNLPIIQNSQAFMVQASSASGAINFAEADKIADEANVFGRIIHRPIIYTNLMTPSADSLILIDGVATGFDNKYAAGVDEDDAQKLWNFDENIALVRNDRQLAIEFRPMPLLTDTLFYKLYLRKQPYTLKIFTQHISENIVEQAWLVDKYLDTRTPVNLQSTTLYNFTPNTDTNSYRNRFMLVLKHKLIVLSPPESSAYATTMEGYISVSPNPIEKGRKALLAFSNLPPGTYKVIITTMDGKALLKSTIQHIGGSNIYILHLNPVWATGSYFITTTNKNGNSTTTKLVIGD